MTSVPSDPRYANAVEAATDDLMGRHDPTGTHWTTKPIITNRGIAEEAAGRALKAALAALAVEGLTLTDTRETERELTMPPEHMGRMELIREVERLRAALRSILLHEYNGEVTNENMRSIAREALSSVPVEEEESDG